jgi:hypothetical protein
LRIAPSRLCTKARSPKGTIYLAQIIDPGPSGHNPGAVFHADFERAVVASDNTGKHAAQCSRDSWIDQVKVVG